MPVDIVVDVYGKFACFTRSNAKVERVSYDAPTPSAEGTEKVDSTAYV